MRIHDEFKEFYNSELMPEIKLVEKDRKMRSRKSTIAIIGAIFFWITLWLLLFPNWRESANAGKTILILLVAVNGFLLTVGLLLACIWRQFNAQFKCRFIQKILYFINPTLEYYPKQHIDKYAFGQSGLFLNRHNRFKGDDLITGIIGQTAMECSELDVSYSDDDSTEIIFKGLFMIADFNKEFHGQTVVLPDKAERIFGRFGKKLQAMNPQRSQLIQLEDSEFEKEFVVYGSDQVEARYILTPALMKRILDLREKRKTQIHLSFYKSNVYIAVSLDRKLFEPKDGNQVDYTAACEYFQDMQSALSIIDELNLNTRIWSKE